MSSDNNTDTQRRTEIAKVITGRLSPLGKLEAIDALFQEHSTARVVEELKNIDWETGDGGFYFVKNRIRELESNIRGETEG